MNIGIVGPGRVAARFAKSINAMPNATLFGVCGKTTAAVEDFINKTNSDQTCIQSTDFDEFIQNDLLDILIIATPDNMHTELVLKALQFNKHLLIEKPLCTRLEEAEKIMAAARNSTSTIALGYHLRWHAGLRLLKQKLQTLNSKLGPYLYTRGQVATECWSMVVHDYFGHALHRHHKMVFCADLW
jgi:predicted dehydrogenase